MEPPKGGAGTGRGEKDHMPVFAIHGTKHEPLRAAIEAAFPGQYHEAWPGFFLVTAEVTTQQVGERMKINDGSKGYVFIASLAGNYWGWGPKEGWEWLELKRKADR